MRGGYSNSYNGNEHVTYTQYMPVTTTGLNEEYV